MKLKIAHTQCSEHQFTSIAGASAPV